MSSPHGAIAHQTSPPELPAASLGGLWSIYYRRGYEDGQRQVIRDLLGALVTVSEDFLKANNGTATDSRKLIYAFERHLQCQIEEIARDGAFVEGGLGI